MRRGRFFFKVEPVYPEVSWGPAVSAFGSARTSAPAPAPPVRGDADGGDRRFLDEAATPRAAPPVCTYSRRTPCGGGDF